jgi:hypothetical protein
MQATILLEIQYLEQGTFFLAETFGIFQELLDLSIAKISDRNSSFSLCGTYLKIAFKFEKTVIIRS